MRGCLLRRETHITEPDARIDGAVGGMHVILITPNGLLHLTGLRIDRDLDPQGAQAGHEFPVKRSDGTGDQRHGPCGPLARANAEGVIDEVKLHFKGAAAIRNGRCGEPTRCDVQRDMSPVVHKWTQLHSDLAHDLHLQMECLAGVPSCLKWERRPQLSRFSSARLAYAFHVFLLLVVAPLPGFGP
jgi:hypothetical protein